MPTHASSEHIRATLNT